MLTRYEKECKETKASESLHNSGNQMFGPKCFDVIKAAGIHFKYLGEPTQTPEYIVRKGDSYYKEYGCIMPLEYTYNDEFYREPMLTTMWGQDTPYNNQAPLLWSLPLVDPPKHTLSGCLAIAISQIMVYHGQPTIYPASMFNVNSLPAWINTYVGKNTNIMSMRKVKALSEDTSSSASIDHISRFIAIIGYMLGNEWGLKGTSAKESQVPKVFNNMGYASSGFYLYSGSGTESSINAGLPVYICGSGVKISDDGHAWVVDGYKIEDSVREDYNYYFDEYGVYHGRRLNQPYGGVNVRRIYFHHNFGWSGGANGYYIDGVFDTTQRYEATAPDSQNDHKYIKIKIIPAIIKN